MEFVLLPPKTAPAGVIRIQPVRGREVRDIYRNVYVCEAAGRRVRRPQGSGVDSLPQAPGYIQWSFS